MSLINFSGIASGIDTEGLVKATSDATRSSRVKPLQTKVDDFTETNDALDELKTLLKTVQTKARDLSTILGGPLQKLATTSDETVLTASATNAATNGTYSLSNISLAKNGTYTLYSGLTTYTGTSDIIDSSVVGTQNVTILIGTGGDQLTVNVPVTNTSTVSDFVSSFNTAAGTRATASLVNIGTGTNDYRIVINSNNTGTAKGSISVSANPITNLNQSASSAATNASFSLSGVGTITRATNAISDVIPGVTFNLNAATTSAVSVTVSDDVAGTTSKVSDFVSAYNEVVTYMAENNTVTREQNGNSVTNIFAPLSKTRIDDNVLTLIRSAISGSKYESGSEIKIMADLGITTERDGTLKFDTDDFSTALSKEPTSVNSILQTFGDTIGLTGGTIDLFTRFGGLFDSPIESNETQIDNLNDRIALVEEQIARSEAAMRARFARLEATMGRLQNQQGALSSAIAQLG
jgi:flagellar hook-associated protein 2